MFVPLGQRSMGDLANIMLYSAERWSNMDTKSRPQFKKEIFKKYQLVILEPRQPLAESNSLLPYLHFLKQAIKDNSGFDIQIKQSRNKIGIEWFWVDIPVRQQMIRIGFQYDRIGAQPPLALTIVLVMGSILTLVTAILLTRRLTIPIERLYQAASDIGKGDWPNQIKEEGPEELQALTRTFNQMNKQVKELLANRTMLLTGIAHDLRTPLTQIQLALEMFPDNGGDIELMESIKDDLDRINHLIGESLSIGLEFAEEKKTKVDIVEELRVIISRYPQSRINFRVSEKNSCLLYLPTLALHRVINNLLENAISYGNSKTVDVSYQCKKDQTIIKIEDRGHGIPSEQSEAVFRPFYRLEKSRNTGTGGSGLGLAIVRQLSDSHNWSIALKPRVGGGTSAILIIQNS
jgi:two-component system osmolarity sensor histidine kinase EnvZ